MPDTMTPEQCRGRDLIAEFLKHQIAAMDTQTQLRALLTDEQAHSDRAQAELIAERAKTRELRMRLRQLASRWSRRGPLESGWANASQCTWAAAEQELSAILDADL